MKTVNERSFYPVTVTFYSGDIEAAPTTIRYRVDCVTTGKQLSEWTTVVPAANVVITVTPEQNAIQDQANRMERKTLTIEADAGTATQQTGRHDWQVRNLVGTT